MEKEEYSKQMGNAKLQVKENMEVKELGISDLTGSRKSTNEDIMGFAVTEGVRWWFTAPCRTQPLVFSTTGRSCRKQWILSVEQEAISVSTFGQNAARLPMPAIMQRISTPLPPDQKQHAQEGLLFTFLELSIPVWQWPAMPRPCEGLFGRRLRYKKKMEERQAGLCLGAE